MICCSRSEQQILASLGNLVGYSCPTRRLSVLVSALPSDAHHALFPPSPRLCRRRHGGLRTDLRRAAAAVPGAATCCPTASRSTPRRQHRSPSRGASVG